MPYTTRQCMVPAIAMSLWLLTSPQAGADADLQIADGLVVGIEYTLTLDDQSVADTNVGGEPLSYIHGRHQILPSLESGLVGMHVGQTKTIKVKAADAYGVYNQTAIVSVDKNQIPPDAKVGSILSTTDGKPTRVLELTDDTATLDFNHPLAGQDLTFDVTILGVERQKPSVR